MVDIGTVYLPTSSNEPLRKVAIDWSVEPCDEHALPRSVEGAPHRVLSTLLLNVQYEI